jgi:hypothetical protein
MGGPRYVSCTIFGMHVLRRTLQSEATFLHRDAGVFVFCAAEQAVSCRRFWRDTGRGVRDQLGPMAGVGGWIVSQLGPRARSILVA